MTKAIVFDLWNTLAYVRGKNPIKKLKFLLKTNDIKAIEHAIMEKKYKDVDEAIDDAFSKLDIKKDKAMVRKMVRWFLEKELDIALFDDVLPVLEELKKDYKIGLLSNTECFSMEFFNGIGFFELFDARCLSCEEGMIKPDPKFFNRMLKKLDVKPEDTVMVGDNLQDDILGAKKVGMKGILIKRDKRYPLLRIEKGKHEKTIKSLHELKHMLE
jgi:HAD superfamily hydrolase (TIGR01549 family)